MGSTVFGILPVLQIGLTIRGVMAVAGIAGSGLPERWNLQCAGVLLFSLNLNQHL